VTAAGTRSEWTTKDLVGAMGGYSDEELAVVRRFLGR
jgi:hypothetical protein